MGGHQVWHALQEELGLEPGRNQRQVDSGGAVAVSCPGICGVGPVLMIDDDVYGNITPGRLRENLARSTQSRS